MEVDASDVRVGAVLSQRSTENQKLHPCAFFSLPGMNQPQEQFGQETELTTSQVVMFFTRFKHDALSRHFMVRDEITPNRDTIPAPRLVATLTWR